MTGVAMNIAVSKRPPTIHGERDFSEGERRMAALKCSVTLGGRLLGFRALRESLSVTAVRRDTGRRCRCLGWPRCRGC